MIISGLEPPRRRKGSLAANLPIRRLRYMGIALKYIATNQKDKKYGIGGDRDFVIIVDVTGGFRATI